MTSATLSKCLGFGSAVAKASFGFATCAAIGLAATAPANALALRSGFDLNTLPANDDGSTGITPIGFTTNFFGTSYNSLFVNNNGNVTFNSALSTFTPFGLTSTATPIIAPFFADVDTRSPGSGLTTYGSGTVDGRNAFGVNWLDVGYFSQNTDRLNDFQLVLIDRSDTGAGNFDIEFNYGQIQWETGEASGGVGGLGGSSARVGFSNGTGAPGSSFELAGSAVNGAFLDGGPNSLVSNRLNSDVDGRYVFSARNGSIDPDPEPIPTPALVPGAIALSLSLLRKRKAEAAAQEAEA